jgi:hypothetical protein
MHVSIVDHEAALAINAGMARDERARWKWPRVALGIILSGGLYPLFVTLAYAVFFGVLVVQSLRGGQQWPEMESVFTFVGAFVVYGGFGIVIGLLLSAVVAIIVLLVTHLVCGSLGLRGDLASRGAFCGGLVGFLVGLPFLTVQ